MRENLIIGSQGRRATQGMLLSFLLVSTVQAAESQPSDVFATVGGERITMQDFDAAYRAGIRKRFYHGKIPDEQLAAFKKEISQTLIDRSLMLQEARRRGVKPASEQVSKELAAYEQRYAKTKGWSEHKDEIRKGLKAALEEQSVLDRFEQQIKEVPVPTEQDSLAYYKKHPELFTTPEQVRLSLIMLKVAPSSTPDVWAAAQQEAEQIRARLASGANFAQLARIHSGDNSASSGGDMGFLHSGMIAPQAQRVVDKLKPGEVSVPVVLLQGVALFRLEERKVASLNEFPTVSDRASKLLQRERSEHAWTDLAEKLRASVKVSINSAAL